MPAHICGISALKPTSGRLPQSGQVLDGGLYGVVGIFNTLGFMAKSASNIKDCMKIFLDKSNVQKITNDARFVPIAWDDTKAKMGQTLRIGW